MPETKAVTPLGPRAAAREAVSRQP